VPAVWFPNSAGRPRRSAASSPPLKKLHPLVADALQVNRIVCDLAMPLLVPVICALEDRSKLESTLPVPLTLPGSLRLSELGTTSVPPVCVPVTAVMRPSRVTVVDGRECALDAGRDVQAMAPGAVAVNASNSRGLVLRAAARARDADVGRDVSGSVRGRTWSSSTRRRRASCS
jgi:hypothetical protein